ncbi:hypothetical protein N836_05555 [Leptolyngbya sp. Heron Island J]|uniref:DUF2267 domain-containing protein n=1 Tax=Leptolyngbya sp. Heron Island J TaxID=1385935 RepID=UPI0003B97E59|nr:DUF2267 domain-containing protein [Leptolyngbya sp. Heron Island J]ESA37029.1 hypothetical protein N836_05555 [Leptolyngbya sp. Heron Island J]
MAGVTINDSQKDFLEQIMQKANFPDIYDARDTTVVVFRTMRDMMTTEASDRIEAAFSNDGIAKLWRDDNVIVRLLSRLRPPLKIESEVFMRRIAQEASVPKDVTPQGVVIAVFSTVRDELPSDIVKEISGYLPEGIKILWEQL